MRERKVDPWEVCEYKVQSVVCGEVLRIASDTLQLEYGDKLRELVQAFVIGKQVYESYCKDRTDDNM